MSPYRISPLKKFFLTTLFIFSGALSTFLYCRLHERGGVYFPGIIYTSMTVFVFLFAKIDIPFRNLLRYYCLMVLAYLITWLVTMATSWFVMICGPITAGFGAVASFMLTERFITKIRFDKTIVFLTGALAFIITDILYFIYRNSFDTTPLEYIFHANIKPAMLFSEFFTCWHLLVGAMLVWTISRPLPKD